MSLTKTVYNNLFRRSSTFALTILVGAFFFERVFDRASDGLFNNLNVGKQWMDVKGPILERLEGEEDED